MKSLSKILAVGTLLSAIFLVGCGNNNNNITCPAGEINENNTCMVAGTSGVGTYGGCAAGMVYTSAGCGTECSYGGQIGGMVLVGGVQQCLPAINTGMYGGAGQCASIPGTYPVMGPNGQILCQPGYGAAPGYAGSGYYYYY